MYLNQEEIEKFEQDGFLVLKDFVSQDACEALSNQATEIVKAFDPAESVSIFTTNKQTRHSDRYFLESGDKIRCFFEEEAFAENGELRQAKSKSINKIGHAMHDLDPVFENFSRTPELAQISKEFGIPMVYGGLYRFEGQVAVLNVNGSPGYSDLFPAPPSVDDTCADAGVLGMLPGIIGHIQALETVKLIVGIEPNLIGKLLIYDGIKHTMETIEL